MMLSAVQTCRGNGVRIRMLVRVAMVCTSALVLSSCSFLNTFVPKQGQTTDVLDRQQHLSVDDFRDMNNIKALEKSAKPSAEIVPTAVLGVPPLPDLAQVLAAPRAPKVANTKLVTLSVTEDVPLRDVLFELGRLANVDIEVGSGLDTTGINLRATDRPFNEVIERIAHLAKLRYSVAGNSIRVERDLPYIKNYSLDFLNIVRSSSSTYNLSTNILSGGGGSGGSSGGGSSGGSSGGSGGGGSSSDSSFGTTGSTNNITSTGESDLFSSLEASISEIISYQADGSQAAGASGAAGVQAGAAAGAAASGAAAAGAGSFVVNRQSNVLTVNASQAQHDMIQLYLNMLSRNSSAQVLIEAKIVEVSLSDQFLSGVNWGSVLSAGSAYAGPGTFLPPSLDSLSLPGSSAFATADRQSFSNAFTLGWKNSDLDAAIALTQRFGTTRTLSSPRLSAINNQQAVLTFARNEIFFNCSAQAGTVVANTGTPGSTATQPTVSCTQQTVPIGIIMSILPSINLNTQEVTLNVRPTLTRQVSTVQNPGNILAAAVVQSSVTINSDVPVIEVRELDSVMKVKSGGVMIIGGLMEEGTRNESTGVPGAGEIPIFGNLFKSRSEDSTKRELIIFIKATIVNSDGSSAPADRLIYEKFTTDPRSLYPKQ